MPDEKNSNKGGNTQNPQPSQQQQPKPQEQQPKPNPDIKPPNFEPIEKGGKNDFKK